LAELLEQDKGAFAKLHFNYDNDKNKTCKTHEKSKHIYHAQIQLKLKFTTHLMLKFTTHLKPRNIISSIWKQVKGCFPQA